MKTNNGKYLAAAVALFAVLTCCLAFAVPASEGAEDNGPLDFSYADIPYGDYGKLDNADLNNAIEVIYNAENKTYTVTGYLGYQDLNDTESIFYKMFTDNSSCNYGLTFAITVNVGDTVKVASDGKDIVAEAENIAGLLYISSGSSSSTVTITPSEGEAVVYTINYEDVVFGNESDVIWNGTDVTETDITNDLIVIADTTVDEAITIADSKKIYIANGVTLTVNVKAAEEATDIIGISSEGAISIEGEGKLIINVDDDGFTLSNDVNSVVAGIKATDITIDVAELDITVNGTVVKPTADPVKNYTEAVYGLRATGDIAISGTNMNITVGASDCLAFAIYGTGSASFTDATGTVIGGNRAIQNTAGEVTFTDSTITLVGSEKAIQSKTVNGSVSLVGSNITLKLADVAEYNGGTDDRFGIKAVNLSVDANSILVTDGLRLVNETSSAYDNKGVVVVNGGYTQNSDAEANPAYVAGLYVDTDFATVEYYYGVPDTLVAGMTYVSGAAAGNVKVAGQSSGGSNIVPNVNAANEALASSDSVTIAAVAGQNVDISGLELTAGKTVTVSGTATGVVDTTAGTIIVNGADDLTVGGVSFTSTGKVTVTYDSQGNAILNGTVSNVDLKEGSTTVVGTINGTVIGGDGGSLTFNNVSSTGGIALAAGSINVSSDFTLNGDPTGGYAIEGDEPLVFTGNVTISGTGTIKVSSIEVSPGVTVTLGANVTIALDGDATLLVNERASIAGEGEIQLLNGNMGITNNGTISVDVVPSGTSNFATAGTIQEFINALPYYNEIKVTADLDFSKEKLAEAKITGTSFTIDNEKKITVASGKTITINDGITLQFTGLSVVDGEDGADFNMKVVKGGTLVIDNSDIFTSVEVEDVDTGLVLRNCDTTITGATTSISDIGFGKTVTFSNGYTIGGAVTVYGTISVPADYVLNISRNADVTVSETGVVDVEGTLNVNGTMEILGTVDIAGTLSMAGTMTVGADAKVDVTGTMTVTGTIGGSVENHGTITYNGKVDSAGMTVNMYNGSTLTVTSVSGGDMTVTGATDYKKADTKENDPVIYNAELTLSGVAGLVVSSQEAIVAATTGTDAQPAKITFTLDISGNVTAGTITSELTATNAGADDTKTGVLTVESTLDLSKGVTLDIVSGKYTINGTINAAAGATILNNGEITVIGEVTTVGTAAVPGIVNAAFYDVTTPAVAGVSAQSVTRTYTSLATAVGVTNADNSTIFISGKLTVAADETVEVPATLKVNYYSGIESSITVDGTLVFSDYETSCLDKVKHINADVMFDETPARTYTSLANAIGMGITDIVLNDNVTIYGNMTIPAGVTVSSDKYGITVSATDKDGKHNDVTLTVEGALELTAQDAGVELESYGTEGKSGYKEAALIVSGMGYVYLNTENTTSGSDYLSDLVSGAYYDINASESGANVVVDVIATVEKAAADSANVYSNTITIKGEVTAAGDLTFTAGEDKALTVKVDGPTDTAFVGQTVTLVGDVTFDATDSSSATVTDGANAVALNKATGVTVSIEPDTDSDVEDATIFVMNGTLVGKATVSAGTVYVDGTVSAASGSRANAVAAAVLDVANGATMVVGDDGLTVNGELSVEGTVQIPESVELTISSTGKAAIGGTVEVTGTMNMNGKTQIDGTVAPAEDAENAKIVVNSIVTVGSKPTEMGQTNAAILSGASYGEATSGVYIKAYNGATVEFADKDYKPVYTQLNIKGADSTGYYLYMTVYAGTTTDLFSVIYEEAFSLNGYDTGLYFGKDSSQNSGLYKIGNWYTSSDRVANTALTSTQNVGFNENAAIYAQVALVKVTGTVSEGTGLNLYIDGVPANSGAIELSIGTHDVAFDVSAQYDGSNAVITLNGEAVTDGKITITSDMSGFVLAVSGATPAGTGEIVVNTGSGDLSLTDILLIVLVILIVIMAIIVALRLMRS